MASNYTLPPPPLPETPPLEDEGFATPPGSTKPIEQLLDLGPAERNAPEPFETKPLAPTQPVLVVNKDAIADSEAVAPVGGSDGPVMVPLETPEQAARTDPVTVQDVEESKVNAVEAPIVVDTRKPQRSTTSTLTFSGTSHLYQRASLVESNDPDDSLRCYVTSKNDQRLMAGVAGLIGIGVYQFQKWLLNHSETIQDFGEGSMAWLVKNGLAAGGLALEVETMRRYMFPINANMGNYQASWSRRYGRYNWKDGKGRMYLLTSLEKGWSLEAREAGESIGRWDFPLISDWDRSTPYIIADCQVKARVTLKTVEVAAPLSETAKSKLVQVASGDVPAPEVQPDTTPPDEEDRSKVVLKTAAEGSNDVYDITGTEHTDAAAFALYIARVHSTASLVEIMLIMILSGVSINYLAQWAASAVKDAR